VGAFPISPSVQSPSAWGTRAKLGERIFPATARETTVILAAGKTVAADMDLYWPYNDTRRFKVVVDGATDNTAKVQYALDSLPLNIGGTVYNEKNSRFSMTGLTFPKVGTLRYFGGDDTSDTIAVTNEITEIVCNANGSGIVNEQCFNAPFHPGRVVNVQRQVTGHDAYLGGGQTKDNPARASYNLMDSRRDSLRMIYELYANETAGTSPLSCAGFDVWIRRWAITGVGSSNYVSAPVVGTLIRGNTSNALGQVVAIAATTMTLMWLRGNFAAGETLRNLTASENSATTVTTATYSQTTAGRLGFSLLNGNCTIGLRPGDVPHAFAVGGAIASAPTRSTGQYEDVTTTDPVFVLADGYDTAHGGWAIDTDTSVANASRRLYARRITAGVQGARAAMLNAVRGFGQVSSAGAISTTAFGFSTFTKTGTGIYELVLTNVEVTEDATVNVTPSTYTDKPVVFSQGSGKINIRNYNNDTGALQDFTGQLNITVLGGDK